MNHVLQDASEVLPERKNRPLDGQDVHGSVLPIQDDRHTKSFVLDSAGGRAWL